MQLARCSRGFTLVELIACLVILATLAALGGARFLDTQSFNQRGYVDELAAALRYAEGVAVVDPHCHERALKAR